MIILFPNKNPQGYKEHVISLITFAFEEGVTINYWLSNMNFYVSDTEEAYIDTGLVTDQDVQFALIFWYVAKIIPTL